MKNRSNGAKVSANRKTLFTRLARDVSGNVLALTAAAVIPMIGIIGGAVDMSRAYRAKARLQAACDAGVLAGRRAMSDLTYTTQAQARANTMFNFNFKPSEYQATGTTFTTSGNVEGVVSGVAVSNVPMALMQVFGYSQFNLRVTCSADYQVPNIDTMLVLDVTGSMADCPDGSDCDSNASSKIAGLRTAVRSFYDTLQAAAASSPRTQIRYGFVPYSQSVNLSQIFSSNPQPHQLPLSHLVDSYEIPSRVANFETPAYGNWAVDPDETPQTYDQRFDLGAADSRRPYVTTMTTGTNISNNDCLRYSENKSFQISTTNDVMLFPHEGSSYQDNFGPSVMYIPEGGTVAQSTEPTTGETYTRITFSRVSGTWTDNNGGNTGQYQKCVRRVTHTKYRRGIQYAFTNWTYRNVTYDVSTFKAGTSIPYVSAINTGTARVDQPTSVTGPLNPVQLRQLPNQTGFTQASFAWNGCIEERTTVANGTFAPIPSGALDLDIESGGTSAATRWKPVLFDLAYLRAGPAEETSTGNNSRPGRTCPTASARNLLPMTSTEIDTYLNSLQANGNTYHDFGMLWGLRLIAPQGMFSARNLTGANGGQISRHIIFMTDGVLVASGSNYSLYGPDQVTQRITGGSTSPNLATRHANRFQALCDLARSEGLSVWVIAFGTSITSNLTACADPGRAYQASNTAQLTQRFQQIANDIADLRLTQ